MAWLETNLSVISLIEWGAAAAALIAILVVAGFRQFAWFGTFGLKTVVKHVFRPLVLILKFGFVASGVRGLNAHSLPFWCWINALTLVMLIALPPERLTFAISIGALTLHFLCFVAALLVIDEETDVWNGLLTSGQSVFHAEKFIKSSQVLVASTVFVVLFGTLGAWLWDATSLPSLQLVATRPDIGCVSHACSYLQYLVAFIYEIPLLGWAIRSLQLTGPAALTQSHGRYLSLAIDFTTATLIFGVFKVLMFQQKAIKDLIVAFARLQPQDVDTARFLRARVERAPAYIRDKLFATALKQPNREFRKRYIATMLRAEFVDFSRLLLQKLHAVGNAWDVRAAIQGISDLVATCPQSFDAELVADSLDALCAQRNGEFRKHAPGVNEKLEALFVDYIQLCVDNRFAIARSHRKVLIEIATSHASPCAAFELAGRLDPVGLLRVLIGGIEPERLDDQEKRSAISERLSASTELVQDRGGDWRRASRRRLQAIAAQRADRIERHIGQSEPDPVLNREIDTMVQTLRQLSAILQASLDRDAPGGAVPAKVEPATDNDIGGEAASETAALPAVPPEGAAAQPNPSAA